MTSSEQHLIDRIRWLHGELASAESLAPGPRIDGLFDELVALTRPAQGEDLSPVLLDERVGQVLPALHELYARGGYAREEYWSRRILAAPDPQAELAKFPFLENYRLLADMEYRTLTGITTTPIKRIVFAGSGPLPLTSIMLAREFGVRSRNVDLCPNAIGIAERLVRRLGVPGLEFECRDVTDCVFEPGDVVVLAASVGVGGIDRKAEVIASLHRQLPEGALLLARSVTGLKGLLYPQLTASDLVGFSQITVAHPLNYVVNSVIVARNQAAAADLPAETSQRQGLAVSAS